MSSIMLDPDTGEFTRANPDAHVVLRRVRRDAHGYIYRVDTEWSDGTRSSVYF